MISLKRIPANSNKEGKQKLHKRIKIIKLAASAVLLLLLFSFTACSKDSIVKGYRDTIELIGKIAVTSDSRLVGKRQKGLNTYTGTYSASYKEYSETEFPFGGTSLEPPGDKIIITCTISIKSGSVKVYFTSRGEETPLADAPGEYTYTLELPPGTNYIGIRGEAFTGEITINAD